MVNGMADGEPRELGGEGIGVICLYKVKAHSGIAGNGCADAIAKHSALHDRGHGVHFQLPAKYPHMCKFLGTIPSNQLQYAKVPFWNNIQIPLSKHSWELQIIAIWNTKGWVCLNAHNKDWPKELAKEIPEAKWEIKNIHNHPYQTALGSRQHSGLNKEISYQMTTLKPQKAQLKQLP